MSIMDIVDTDTEKWDYLNEFVPDLDYHKVHSDYRSPTNIVGYIQRAVVIYWAIREHERTGGIGLEPGCGQAISPFCVGTDYYAGQVHPVYGGAYQPHVRSMGEVLPFNDRAFDFIVSHHSLEHMRDTEKTLREWLRVLKPGGKIVVVMPDKNYGPFGDPSHVSECTPEEFRRVLERIENIRIIQLDSLRNHFSFDALIEKTGEQKQEQINRGENMEPQTIEEINLRTQLRTLWQDRAMWTRMLIISVTTTGLEKEADYLLKRLRKNQVDIGEALKPYLEKYLFCWDDIPGKDSQKLQEYVSVNYGANWLRTSETVSITKEDGAIVISSGNTSIILKLNNERTEVVLEMDISGKTHEFKFQARDENGRLNIYFDINESAKVLTSILISNITITNNLIKAKKSGDINKELDAEEALKENATSFAAYLCGFNPNQSYKSLEKMLVDYNRLIKEVIIARLNNNSDADPASYEKLLELAPKIADALVDSSVNVKQAG